jgi:hypothetical protein
MGRIAGNAFLIISQSNRTRHYILVPNLQEKKHLKTVAIWGFLVSHHRFSRNVGVTFFCDAHPQRFSPIFPEIFPFGAGPVARCSTLLGPRGEKLRGDHP